MNRVKYDILRAALERIGACQEANRTAELAHIARTALQDAAQVIEYRITARTWYGRNGGEFKAELRRTDTGEELITVSGTTWGSDAWSYDMRDAMHAKRPDLFPAHGGRNPTIYFREVCKVEYEHAEVARKRDL
jgi:hypothetical protein